MGGGVIEIFGVTKILSIQIVGKSLMQHTVALNKQGQYLFLSLKCTLFKIMCNKHKNLSLLLFVLIFLL